MINNQTAKLVEILPTKIRTLAYTGCKDKKTGQSFRLSGFLYFFSAFSISSISSLKDLST